MPYENIPGVGATYLDGFLTIPAPSVQPSILVLGACNSGLSYILFNVTNVGEAEQEFGAANESLQTVHELVAQGADNVRMMRIGGKAGSLVITDSDTDTLTIIPTQLRDDAAMDRYALVMEVNSGEQRILVWDLEDEAWVYDSDEALVINDGSIRVVDAGLDLFSVATLGDPSTYKAFSALITGDFTQEGTATISSVLATQGTDGTSMSHVERYAALNEAYWNLDFRDLDMCVPRAAYVDAQNVVDGDTCNFYKGVPVRGTSCDTLGYAWEYVYQGKKYTYFVDSATYFADEGSAAASTVTVNTDLVLTADKTGVGGDNISIEIDATGPSGPTVTISEPDCQSLKIFVEDDGTATTSATVTAINTALGLFTVSTGVLASTLVTASGGAATTLTNVSETPLASGAGGHVLTHQDLTGDSIPAAVTTRFAAGADTETREVNFAHQMGTFCHLASTTWKSLIGAVSFEAPPAVDRVSIASWVGSLPTYTSKGTQLVIDVVGDNGSGLLGNKFLAGAFDYRNGVVEAGDADDGIKGGGFILTKGTGLPNDGTSVDNPYGVLDTDEAVDATGRPIDLGKYIRTTYDWPIHRNSYNGGTSYRGPMTTVYIGKLAITPVNKEPIGINGEVRRVSSPPRIYAPQQNDLAGIRAIGLRRDDDVGLIIVSSNTSAHPTSDWTKESTIRSVNSLLDGIRRVAKPYIGEAFAPERLQSLQAAIDGFLVAERALGTHQGAAASLSFTRSDRILGKLKVRLRVVPPFSIRTITVETSLAADETEL